MYILTFNKKGTGYDVALLALDGKAILNRNVQKAILPEPNSSCPDGMSLIVSGWGAYAVWEESVPYLDYYPIYLATSKHSFLWAVKQKCVDIERCQYFATNIERTLYNPETFLCVAGPCYGVNNGAFKGDSGGTQ